MRMNPSCTVKIFSFTPFVFFCCKTTTPFKSDNQPLSNNDSSMNNEVTVAEVVIVAEGLALLAANYLKMKESYILREGSKP